MATLELPEIRSVAAPEGLFHGTIYFVRIMYTVTRPGQPDEVFSISNADMGVAIAYATRAVVPISRYASQYGPNQVAVSPNMLTLVFKTGRPWYHDSDLQSWVNKVKSQYRLSNDSCVAVLTPPGITNIDAPPPVGGYHSAAHIPYLVVYLQGDHLTLNDCQPSLRDGSQSRNGRDGGGPEGSVCQSGGMRWLHG